MRKKRKTDVQKERDKRGVDRIKRYEKNRDKKAIVEEDEEDFMVAYQKIEPGVWEKIRIKKSKKL